MKTARVGMALIAVMCLAMLAVACGGGEEEGPTPAITPAAAETPTPADVGEVPGITDTQIVIGAHSPLAGAYGAVYSMIPGAQQAYYRYINETQGGVCGREIVFKVEDDGHDPAQALEVTRKLVERDKVFAMVGSLGDHPHSGVWEYLNEEGIPDILVSVGASEIAPDPEEYPWTAKMLSSYWGEGHGWGAYISQNLVGEKVAVLYENSAFGLDGVAGLKEGLDPEKNDLVSEQSCETTAVSVRPQVAAMKNAGANLVILFTTPGFTAQALKEAHRMGWSPQWVLSYVNTDATMFQFVSPELMEGAYSVSALKLADWTDDPAIAEHYRIMQEYDGPNPANFTVYGQSIAELAVEILSRACDNLTRQGLMDAVHSVKDWHSDLFLDGVTVTYSETDNVGLGDAYRTVVAVVEDGKGRWEYFGPLQTPEGPVSEEP